MEIKKIIHPKRPDFNLMTVVAVFGILLLIIGVATIAKKVADWGAENKIVKQRIIDLQVRWPYRIEKIVNEPVKEIVVVGIPYENLTSTEQKIIQIWGDYKTAMIAIAVFKCESGLDPLTVSKTGDVGVAQIHWPLWKDAVKKEFGYNVLDMFDVNKNLEVAKWIYDRSGSFEPWVAYTSGSYISCLN
jgi:Co/Zn/Cd efflux system component